MTDNDFDKGFKRFADEFRSACSNPENIKIALVIVDTEDKKQSSFLSELQHDEVIEAIKTVNKPDVQSKIRTRASA